MTNGIRLAAVLIVLHVPPSLAAATLTDETKAAWDVYLGAANAAMQARLQPGAHFLWLDDEPGRAEAIRAKGPYIAPARIFQRKFHPDSFTTGLAWASFRM